MKKKFTSYNKCIDYLFNLERGGIKYDLRNIKSLVKPLKNPQNNFKSIHIAGTNGKGSVASILNSLLTEKGFTCGLYTSPHIRDFRERILVNGKYISKNFIINFVNRIYDDIKKIKPSFFEVTTAMAFEYFSLMKVDYAVIETGLGGRLDSTNILKPILSIITSISIDHTDFLGKTIESITKEKGGIIKEGVPVVIGNTPELSRNILVKIAKKNRSKVFIADTNTEIKINKRNESGFYFKYNDRLKKIFFPSVGDFQLNNISIAKAALDMFKESENISFTNAEIKSAYKNLKANSNFQGRFELLSKNPKVVVDVSHNLQAIENVKENLKYFKYNRLFIIFGMMADKNYKDCLRELSKLNAEIILTKPDYKRAATPAELYKNILHDKDSFTLKHKMKDAFKYVYKKANAGDMILVTGSFFLVSDFLKLFNKSK